MIISIIGLGLIGGSLARRLRGFRNAEVYGVDINESTLKTAMSDGVIAKSFTKADEAAMVSDLIILCMYPEKNVEFIKSNAHLFKKGAVITDVSGVKEYILSSIEGVLPEGVEFVGGHPMAGREVGGYMNSTDTLFNKASYLITPTASNSPEAIELVRSMAEYIGCARVVTTTPKEHDAMIAYTSQLMHVVAIALCDNPLLERSGNFSAGSLRDCTRVANINAEMWSELFLENSTALSERIEEMCQSLYRLKDAIDKNDRTSLFKMLENGAKRKQKWLSETMM